MSSSHHPSPRQLPSPSTLPVVSAPSTLPRVWANRAFATLSFAAFAYVALPARAQLASAPSTTLLSSVSLPDSPGAALLPPSSALPPRPSPALADAANNESSSTATLALFPEPTSAGFGQSPGQHSEEPASTKDKYIDPGQHAPSLTAADKVQLGLRDAVSPFAIIGWITSAAYSQAIDNAPNYGQGWGPFAQRLGASAARAGTEGVLSDSVFAPVFHEDPRYYRLGPGTNVVHRTLYAVTRTVITRSDSGRATPNFALIAGNAAGSILTNAYYPDRNRDAKTTVETFAGSIGGSALGFFVSEFLSDALGIVHLK